MIGFWVSGAGFRVNLGLCTPEPALVQQPWASPRAGRRLMLRREGARLGVTAWAYTEGWFRIVLSGTQLSVFGDKCKLFPRP